MNYPSLTGVWSSSYTSADLKTEPSYFFGQDIARQMSETYEKSIRELLNPNVKPKRIISIDNKTIKCVFKDNTEIFVTVQEPDIFSEEIGIALAIARKIYGSNTKYLDSIEKIIERPTPAEKKKKKVKKA